jgi:YD repeat-containing protein
VIVPAAATTGKVSLKIGSPSAAATTDFTVLPNPKGTLLIGELRTQPGYKTTDKYTYVFNSNNKLDSISDLNTDGTGAYTSTSKILRDASGNVLQITKDDGSFQKMVYDNANRIIKVQTTGSDNKTITDSITYQYFADRYERTEVQGPSTAFAAIFKYVSYYTADGKNIAAQKNYNGAGTLIYSATYTYDDKINLHKLKGLDFMGLLFADPSGLGPDFVNTNNVKDIMVMSGTPSTVHYAYNYNSDGYVISSMWWTDNNPPTVSSVFQYK